MEAAQHVEQTNEQLASALIEKVKSFDNDFKSNYITAIAQLDTMCAADAAESFADIQVADAKFADVENVIEQVLKTGGTILQLSFERWLEQRPVFNDVFYVTLKQISTFCNTVRDKFGQGYVTDLFESVLQDISVLQPVGDVFQTQTAQIELLLQNCNQ